MNKLREMRKKHSKTAKEIAAVLNVSLMAVYNYENNYRSISTKQLKQLVDYYGCKFDDLID